MENEGHDDMSAAVRSASRWMWASAALDLVPILGFGLGMISAPREEFHPAIYRMILLTIVAFAAFVGTCAWWKARAGKQLRDAASGKGEALATAFLLLRRYFAAMVISSVLLMMAAAAAAGAMRG